MNKKIFNFFIITITFIVFVLFLANYFFKDRTYDISCDLINQKDYTNALELLRKIDSTDKYYNKAKSKINYISGIFEFQKENYIESISYFNSVDSNDIFISSVDEYRNIIIDKPEYIYMNGINLIINKKVKEAVVELNKIKNNERYSRKVESALTYIDALRSFANKNYENVINQYRYLDVDDKLVESYNRIIEGSQNEINRKQNYLFAKSIIDYYHAFLFEFENIKNLKYIAFRTTFLETVKRYKSFIYKTNNMAKNKDVEIENFKILLIQYLEKYEFTFYAVEIDMISKYYTTNYDKMEAEKYFNDLEKSNKSTFFKLKDIELLLKNKYGL